MIIKVVKKVLLGITIAMFPSEMGAQITLEECQRLARENYPLLRRYDLITQSTEYNIENISKGYLPQISAVAQASYQSDVPSLPDALTNMMSLNGYDPKGMRKDQYRIGLNIDQLVWDGGNIKARKNLTQSQDATEKARVEVDLYALRSRINDLYFGILLIDEKIKLNAELQTLLQANYEKLETMNKGGIAMKCDVDLMRAEYLNACQQYTQLETMRESYVAMLAIFISRPVEAINKLQKPETQMPESMVINRPEMRLFDAQLQYTHCQEELLNSSFKPRVSLYAQGYYGYPGYNMFNDMISHDWSLNGIIGVRVAWNIGSFYTKKTDKNRLALSRENIETRRDVFVFNNNIQSTQLLKVISQYETVLKQDDDIISLRKDVRMSSESRLNHGVIDVNNLLQDITRENQACINKTIHEVELLRNIYNLKYTINQ